MPYFSLTFRVKSSGSLDGQDNLGNSYWQEQKEKGNVGGEKMKEWDDAEFGKFYIFFQNLKLIKGNNLSFSFRKVLEYTEELYKKDLHDPHKHNGVITHLELDILECEVKWALDPFMTKASGGDGISVDIFQILKDDAMKVCTQYASKFGKLSSGHRTGKGQFSF